MSKKIKFLKINYPPKKIIYNQLINIQNILREKWKQKKKNMREI